MLAVLKIFLDISLLSGKPQDLPASNTLLWLTALSAAGTNYIADGVHPDLFVRLLFALAETVLLGLVVWVALVIRHYPERWPQTMMALYASSVFVNITTWPVILWLTNAPASDWPIIVGLAITVWFIAIMARVLHYALTLPVALSTLVSLACLMTTGLILIKLFGLTEN